MPNREIHRTFRRDSVGIPVLLLFSFVFGWIGMHGLQGDKCPYAPWLVYIFYVPALLIAASFLISIVFFSDTDLSLYACPEYLRITSRWIRLNESHEFVRDQIRSISIIPTVSEGVPSNKSYYLVVNIWMDEPFRISNSLEKSDAIRLAQSLADIYEVPFKDHSGEVILSEFHSCDAFLTHIKRAFKRKSKK